MFVLDYFIGSPADRAGIRAGDLIISINRREGDYETLRQMVAGMRSGDTAVFTVIRDGISFDFTMTLDAWADEFFEDTRLQWPGLDVHPQSLNVTYVELGSPAAFTGIQQGDRITHINDFPVTDFLSFYKVL